MKHTATPTREQILPAPSHPWHALPAADAVAALGTDPVHGLAADEAAARLARYGPNRLVEERRVTFWKVAREEVAEPMILLLLAVGVIYALSGEPWDAIAIFCIIAGITFVEVFNEYRAKAAIASLQKLSAPTARAVRGGVPREVNATELVPGDLVLLAPGERVPADLRLLEAAGLRVDESGLTGESAPVPKGVDVVPEQTELGDRRSMAHAASLVTGGKGRGVVVGTGMATELGRIAGLARAAREPRTPLQNGMRQLAGFLVWLALGFSLLVPTLGLLFGQPPREMLLTGLTLAFATIPEELPILITVVLGLGALRLSQRHAIIKRLRTAETLGSVFTIASDKTGTFTENHMALCEMWLPGQADVVSPSAARRDPAARRLLELGALANDAAPAPSAVAGAFAGDPTDVALVEAATAAGIDVAALRGAGPLAELTFDDRRRLMSAAYPRDGALVIAAKGAPEAILSRCRSRAPEGAGQTFDPAAATSTAEAMAGRGLRVLALASKSLPMLSEGGLSIAPEELPSMADLESNLDFAGLVGLLDPPRPEVPAALKELRSAGIRVLMLTGDHPATARAVADRVGIDGGRVIAGREIEAMADAELRAVVAEASLYARIAPEHKLRIVRALQARGEVVAVTGDGVNDAPALKEAAIGVAMGRTGTDVAKEAAGMVLGDDNFATIAASVREGRKLYDNLRKAVRYYLAAKVALVSSSLIAVLAQLPVPFSPIQIIVTELFMDLGASVAFTSEKAEGDVMARPPRDTGKPFMDRAMQAGIFSGGLSLCAAVVATYLWAYSRGSQPAHAQTIAFATWMVGHVLLALQMRSERQPLLLLGPLSNPTLLLWGVGAVGLAVLGTDLPLLRDTLKLTPLAPTEWALVLAAPVLTTSWWEAYKLARWRL